MAKGYLRAKYDFDQANERELGKRRELGETVIEDAVFHRLNLTARCQMCNQMVFEILPLGPDGESICEDCADKDPQGSEKRWREQGGRD